MPNVTFFGTSAAVPSLERGFSCMGIFDHEDIVLLDCGDGAIRNILRYGADIARISDVLISHHHSDHLSGLTQLIETMGILRRQAGLNVFGPVGLKEYFSTVRRITNVASKRSFEINLIELGAGQKFSFSNYQATTFEMDHTVPCLGYRIESGKKILSFTGDTQPSTSVVELARDADLLIHESTYLNKDIERARAQKHSTSIEAAQSSASAAAKRLVLTHINDEREKPEEMLREASGIFSNTTVASDGLSIAI